MHRPSCPYILRRYESRSSEFCLAVENVHRTFVHAYALLSREEERKNRYSIARPYLAFLAFFRGKNERDIPIARIQKKRSRVKPDIQRAFRVRNPGARARGYAARVPLTRGVTLAETTCESWRDDRRNTQETESQECVRPGRSRTSSGQLTPHPLWILQSTSSHRYVPVTISSHRARARARVVDRPANSGRAIDVTGSWLSDGFGDPLSRYRLPRWPAGYSLICASPANCGKLLLHRRPGYVLKLSLFQRGGERRRQGIRQSERSATIYRGR